MNFLLPFNDTSLSPVLNSELNALFPVSISVWHVLGSYYTLNIVLGLLGNCLVLHAFQFPDILDYKKVSRVILTNLAVVDVLVILIQGVPTVGVFFTRRWPFGSGLCHFLALVKYILFYMEVSLVLILSAHRAYILTYPFRGRLITQRSAVKTVVLCWIISFLLNVVGLVGSDVTLFDARFLSCNAGIYLKEKLEWEGYLLGVSLFVAAAALGLSLLVVGWKARRARIKSKRRGADIAHFGLHQFSWERRFWNFIRRNKSTVTVVSVAVVFMISIVPVFLVHLFKYLGVCLHPKLALFEEIFVMLNVVINPFIYSLTNPTFLQFYRNRWTF